MKTMIDLNDEAHDLAARELGTTTKEDTVNAALEFVANRRRHHIHGSRLAAPSRNEYFPSQQ